MPWQTLGPHILKVLGSAWAWRLKLDTGWAATVEDIAKAEKVKDRLVSRTIRLAYLSPELLVSKQYQPSISQTVATIIIYLPSASLTIATFGSDKQLKD
ncbi:hypothetical protein [Aestuariivirga sp.]|uniref:hypothetical protein n=1 Tax=Aestuariivirga sp. TaxID=2650926 RepID=UPI003783D490